MAYPFYPKRDAQLQSLLTTPQRFPTQRSQNNSQKHNQSETYTEFETVIIQAFLHTHFRKISC